MYFQLGMATSNQLTELKKENRQKAFISGMQKKEDKT